MPVWQVRGIARSFIVGIPKGRFCSVPGLGIHTRLVGLTFEPRFKFPVSSRRCFGVSDLTPSTPAVFFPWLSWVTLRTEDSSCWPWLHQRMSGVCDMLWHHHGQRLDKFYEWSLYTLRSSLRQLIECHSTISFLDCVLDIYTHYLGLYLPNHRKSVCIFWALPQTFASDSISPTRCIRLAPAQVFDLQKSKREVISFRMTILCTVRVMLFAGFIGSACWSDKYMPTPYPLPFGSSAFSLISLVFSNDDSNASSSLGFTHGYFARCLPT
jgi:hypothetical protein